MRDLYEIQQTLREQKPYLAKKYGVKGVKVDLAIKKNLKKRVGRRILQEVVLI